MQKKNVVIGFLGTQLDAGQGAGRWITAARRRRTPSAVRSACASFTVCVPRSTPIQPICGPKIKLRLLLESFRCNP